MQTDPHCQAELEHILEVFACQTGTIHRSKTDGATLEMVAQVGVPDFLLEKVARIPFGKGIAGAAAERKEPVELCNLQQDLGGVAKEDARKTGVSGSIAVPIFLPGGDQVIGTLGIGKLVPHDFTPHEKAGLAGHAEKIAEHFRHNPAGGD